MDRFSPIMRVLSLQACDFGAHECIRGSHDSAPLTYVLNRSSGLVAVIRRKV
jgi:hypothetical protein